MVISIIQTIGRCQSLLSFYLSIVLFDIINAEITVLEGPGFQKEKGTTVECIY